MSNRLPLATGRLVMLRPFTLADINPCYIAWLNDREVMRFSRHRHRTHDYASCLDYLQSFTCSGNLFLAIERRDDSRFIGTTTAYIDQKLATADIGILIGETATWGSGLGRDAWVTLMTYLIRNCAVRTVTAGTLVGNLGMKQIMEKSGMHLREFRTINGTGSEPPEAAVFYEFTHVDN